ncbi:MAG: solute carrier family 23 protein [Syntrophales bacterium]|jgi:xanthine/uracil permease
MQFKYDLEDHPPLLETILYGLQWFAISIPIIIVIGKITGIFHFSAIGEQTIYLQKLTFVMALALLAQIFWGHRMPLIVGPSSVLLIGIIASGGFPVETIYTSVLVGGVLLAIVSATGLLGHLKKLFSPRLVAIVLILIAFTLAPTILNLIDLSSATATPLSRILFTLFLLMSMLIAERFFKGVWKSTLIIWAMIAGSLVWFMLFPETFRMEQISYAAPLSGFFKHLTTKLSFNAGVMISFMVCFLALFINV